MAANRWRIVMILRLGRWERNINWQQSVPRLLPNKRTARITGVMNSVWLSYESLIRDRDLAWMKCSMTYQNSENRQ